MDKKRVYTYAFANGDKVTVDEAALGDRRRNWDKWMEVLERLDLDEQANDKKETRRHCSYDLIDHDEVLFGTEDCPESLFFFKEMYAEFIKDLTEREFRIYYTRFVEGISQLETAEKYNTVHSNISGIEKDIKKKMKKIKKSWKKK
jgi:DNA-directed RNA polymerase specialized sigma subunit